MITCRLMALATYSEYRQSDSIKVDPKFRFLFLGWLCLAVYLTPEETAASELFLYEPTLISQIAALAHPTALSKVGDRVLAAAYVALESCVRFRSKATEVLAAVNANAGHGILMSCFRALVARLGSNEGEHEIWPSSVMTADTMPSFFL